jgi:hypothetical protein
MGRTERYWRGGVAREDETQLPCTVSIDRCLEQFGAFSQDAIDNKALLAKVGKLSMPVLAIRSGGSLCGTAIVPLVFLGFPCAHPKPRYRTP